MFNSSKYWNDRYAKGGNSGAGSYNNLALFKANIINNFVDKNKIQSIIDYGVGDGNQLKLLNTNTIKYTGIDVSDVIINKCKEMFKEDKDKTFINANDIDTTLKADLVLSCDVIYHLIEDNIYLEYMNKLFSMSNKYVIIYAKNENINHAQHVKFRKFTDYIDEFLPMWNLIEFIPNQYPQTKLGDNNNNTSPSDFYIYNKVDNVIITMNIGNRLFINYTKPFMIKYSLKTNSKLIIIDDSNIKNIDKYFKNLSNIQIGRNNNKSYLYKILVIIYYSNIFKKILWVDDTCIIKNECPNLFDIIDDNDIMAYNEGSNITLNSWKNNKTVIKTTLEYEIDTNKYINSGVVLYSNKINKYLNIENIVKYKSLFNNPYPHQCFLNFIIQYYNIKLKLLSSSFNCIMMNCSYNENGKNITPNNIGDNFILSSENFIYHITSFYKYRLDIIKYIYNILTDTNYIPFYNNNIQLAKEVINDIKNNTTNDNMLIFGLGYDSKMWYNMNNNTYFIENNDEYINLNTDIIPRDHIIKYDYNNITVENSFSMRLSDIESFKIPETILKLAPFKIILIDGPTGYDNKPPGRLIPIFWSKKLSNKNTLIYVDDSSRKLESYAINKFYTHNNKIIFNSRLKCTKIFNNKIPIYISLTSIYQNQDILLDTLKSIINQTIKPDKIFLYLSEEEYILDSGFKNKNIPNNNLLNFISENNVIDLIWVKNTGSYRKLLPLLENKWNEDCIIITIDDDTIYDENLIKNLTEDYSKYKCVIGYRGFTLNYTNENDFDYNKRHSKLHNLSLYNFLTGKGGILYKPQFFHKTKSLIFNDNIYMNTCNTHDDIWFYILRILNNINCYINNKKWMVKDNSKTGLYLSYNAKNNGNTHAFKNTIKLLKNDNYQNYIPF